MSRKHNAARKRVKRRIPRTCRRNKLRQQAIPHKLQSLSDCIFRSPPITWAYTRQTRRMRSESFSFSEICNSRCLAQFAASFNDPRAKAFVVARDRKHRIHCNEIATSTSWKKFLMIKQKALYGAWRVRIEHIFVRMILPQVHLRKPCYDFSFL